MGKSKNILNKDVEGIEGVCLQNDWAYNIRKTYQKL